MIGHRRADLLARAVASLCRYAPANGWELILVRNGQFGEVAR